MTTDGKQILQWVAGGLLVALGLSAVVVYMFDSINGRPVDASTTSLIALVVGVISSVFSFNIGASSTQSATAQANQNTAAVVAAANGTAGPVAKAHVGLGASLADAPNAPVTTPTVPAAPADGASPSGSSDNGGA